MESRGTNNSNAISQARCIHASRLPEYRTPFGARPCDSHTELFFDCYREASGVTLCYTYGLYKFSYHEEPMYRVSGSSRYHVDLMLPHEPSILFYWFRFKVAGDCEDLPEGYRVNKPEDISEDAFTAPELTLYYGAAADTADGEGTLYREPPRVGADEDKYPYAFQITVYNKEFKTPDYMKGANIYQIFPDRFARDTGFNVEAMKNANPRPERVYHEDWDEDVDIYGKPETGYLACDFYGGSLRGIKEKLPYLKELGINILYMNPIFEARSSHRYDTADYLNVDPMLGGVSAFNELSREAGAAGIKIILDGVFSHTGADSIYFDKFGRYGTNGAYEAFRDGTESRYRSWYNLYRTADGNINYDSWWGFPDLPNVNEDDLSYRNFIFGDQGVVDTWTSRGADGFRLDVSDELPDGFIRQMRSTLKAKTNGEGMLVGEVWEDASNKCSYGSYRDFMLGNTHDSVMGYTFRHILLDFLCGYISAEVADSRFEGFRERYPSQAYYCMMNLVSSHDVPRIMTMLGKPCETDDRDIQRGIEVDAGDYDRCASLARMAYAFQNAYIGAACLYYGDEVLMQGYKDPFNRRTYPWNRLTSKQTETLAFFKRIAGLRKVNSCLRTGFYKTLLAHEGAFAFERYLSEGRDFFGHQGTGARKIVFLMNRSEKPLYAIVSDSFAGTAVTEITGDWHPPLSDNLIFGGTENGTLTIGLRPYSAAYIIY